MDGLFTCPTCYGLLLHDDDGETAPAYNVTVDYIHREQQVLYDKKEGLRDEHGVCLPKTDQNRLGHLTTALEVIHQVRKERERPAELPPEVDTIEEMEKELFELKVELAGLKAERAELMDKLNTTQNMVDEERESLSKDEPPNIDDMTPRQLLSLLRQTSDTKTLGRLCHMFYQEGMYANDFDYNTFDEFLRDNIQNFPVSDCLKAMITYNDSVEE